MGRTGRVNCRPAARYPPQLLGFILVDVHACRISFYAIPPLRLDYPIAFKLDRPRTWPGLDDSVGSIGMPKWDPWGMRDSEDLVRSANPTLTPFPNRSESLL
ncbi:unnamed protein product [Rhizoctonia solani]|uniref:Uncharacterized protein n=1 Tax=Rhizoctonia solani TaxID=456999 RepID=A0A8H3AET0_9AGAM|nr:unnamed protein product [Rhizoctonia solani]